MVNRGRSWLIMVDNGFRFMVYYNCKQKNKPLVKIPAVLLILYKYWYKIICHDVDMYFYNILNYMLCRREIL